MGRQTVCLWACEWGAAGKSFTAGQHRRDSASSHLTTCRCLHQCQQAYFTISTMEGCVLMTLVCRLAGPRKILGFQVTLVEECVTGQKEHIKLFLNKGVEFECDFSLFHMLPHCCTSDFRHSLFGGVFFFTIILWTINMSYLVSVALYNQQFFRGLQQYIGP